MKRTLIVLGLALAALVALPPEAHAAPLKVVATTPDLGSLAREIGGTEVAVTVLSKGTENPHFVEAKPSFIKDLSQADLFIETGMELESAWSSTLLKNCRNERVQPGAKGYLDASTVISPLEVPHGVLDRALGDVHPAGNPHYLLDPLAGLKVAGLIAQRLSELRPAGAAAFRANLDAFRKKLYARLVGPTLAAKYDAGKLAVLFEAGKLSGFLKQQEDEKSLGGWLGAMLPYHGAKAVGDHNLWPYFAKRFGLVTVGFMEPKPGIAPTTHHLQELIQMMKTDGVKLILASSYYDPRHARFVATNSGAKVATMANQVGARAGTDDYLSMTDYNVRQIVDALAGTR